MKAGKYVGKDSRSTKHRRRYPEPRSPAAAAAWLNRGAARLGVGPARLSRKGLIQ